MTTDLIYHGNSRNGDEEVMIDWRMVGLQRQWPDFNHLITHTHTQKNIWGTVNSMKTSSQITSPNSYHDFFCYNGQSLVNIPKKVHVPLPKISIPLTMIRVDNIWVKFLIIELQPPLVLFLASKCRKNQLPLACTAAGYASNFVQNKR